MHGHAAKQLTVMANVIPGRNIREPAEIPLASRIVRRYKCFERIPSGFGCLHTCCLVDPHPIGIFPRVGNPVVVGRENGCLASRALAESGFSTVAIAERPGT